MRRLRKLGGGAAINPYAVRAAIFIDGKGIIASFRVGRQFPAGLYSRRRPGVLRVSPFSSLLLNVTHDTLKLWTATTLMNHPAISTDYCVATSEPSLSVHAVLNKAARQIFDTGFSRCHGPEWFLPYHCTIASLYVRDLRSKQ